MGLQIEHKEECWASMHSCANVSAIPSWHSKSIEVADPTEAGALARSLRLAAAGAHSPHRGLDE